MVQNTRRLDHWINTFFVKKFLKMHPFLLPMKTTQIALRNLCFQPELLPTDPTPGSQDHLRFKTPEEFKAE